MKPSKTLKISLLVVCVGNSETLKNFDNDESTAAVFLNIEKSFDTAWLNI